MRGQGKLERRDTVPMMDKLCDDIGALEAEEKELYAELIRSGLHRRGLIMLQV
jgi:hypothetical protein